MSGNVGQNNEFDWKTFRMIIDKGQQPSDVEFKNPVPERLIAFFDMTGLKLLVEFKLGYREGFFGRRTRHDFHCNQYDRRLLFGLYGKPQCRPWKYISTVVNNGSNRDGNILL